MNHSIQHHYFPDRGYVLHRIPAPAGRQWLSAWFKPDGKFIDAEFLPSQRKVRSAATIAYLERVARPYRHSTVSASTLSTGITNLPTP